MKTTTLITAVLVFSLIGAPAVTFAKARGGSGGYSSGSRSSGTSGGMGSRGSRTHDQNGARPIERSATPSVAPSRPAGTPSAAAPATQSSAAVQPSFLQRHPLLAGIAGGMAGSWIGHMLFGTTDSAARVSEEARDGGSESNSSGSPGLLILLMLLGVGVAYYYMRSRRTPAPDFSGLTRSAVDDRSVEPRSPGGLQAASPTEPTVTPGDDAAFRQILIEVQTAWGKGDLAQLRRLVTPEMLFYFSTGLSENTSQEVENRVEDIQVVASEVRESWMDDATQYVTLVLRWTARDYTVSLSKRPGEPGYVVEGSEQMPRESEEMWTFMRYQHGKWLLSAIQQM